jgi:ketosteroid isomerase-like protein
MTSQRATDEADIRRRLDIHLKALRDMDLEGVMSMYASDIVCFDLDPPLLYSGWEAKRKRWTEVLAMFQPPLDYEIRDFTLTLADDIAFGYSLNRMHATLKTGRLVDYWLRWTVCFRKIDSTWLIVHEQVSVPADIASGKAVLDLKP